MAQKSVHNKHELLSLREMFSVVGDQLTARDVRVLRFMFSGIFTSEFLSQIHDGVSFLQALEKVDRIDESNFKNLENYLRLINRYDLYQFLTLRKRTPVKPDPVTEYLESISSRSTCSSSTPKPCPKCEAESQKSKAKSVFIRKSKSPCPGHSLTPGESNLLGKCSSTTEQNSDSDPQDPGSSTAGDSLEDKCQMEMDGPGPSKRRRLVNDTPINAESSSNPISVAARCMKHCSHHRKQRRHSHPGIPLRRSERIKKRYSTGNEEVNRVVSGTTTSSSAIRTAAKNNEDMRNRATCAIRLRVRAEYCSHEGALRGNIHSNKPELIEQQFEKFMQASTILKSRDLGAIICDIKFSDLMYLDAFWRDYINGSLLEALKGVFITETLKQAVGHETIKLMVNVDEDDYESGRLALLKNLQHRS